MSLKRAEYEIEDGDKLCRRVSKLQIDEEEKPIHEAFSLRVLSSGLEAYLSVDMANLTTPAVSVTDSDRFHLFSIVASDTRNIKLGVAHSPSIKNNAHAAVCGFFDEHKCQILALAAQKEI
jgi:hypothetical protein